MNKKGTGRRKRELTEPNIRSECVDGSREEMEKKHKFEGTNKLCTRLQEPPLDGKHKCWKWKKSKREGD